MTNDEIKKECDRLYESNKENKEKLEALRALCKHEHTFNANFSYGPGRISPATFCQYCNKVIKHNSGFYGEII